ncbi:MAG TPA: hypothetical protein VGG03_17825 [Thermoanaerobaculia bacterium]|jgi:hypothetical protein
MGIDQSNKRGLRSGSKKEASMRHGFEPAPDASPVPGAFGRRGDTAGDLGSEELAHRTEQGEREKVDES